MTGRRPMAGWDARLSRALQFQPGHVGGRVASAQPVRRNGGTLRRPAVGAMAAPVPPLAPGLWKFDEASGNLLCQDTSLPSFITTLATGDTFRVPALAPGSAYAYRSSYLGSWPIAYFTAGMGGTLVLDYWVDHVVPDPFNPGPPDYGWDPARNDEFRAILRVALDDDSAGLDMRIANLGTGSPGSAELRFVSEATGAVIASTTSYTGPLHVVWTTNLTTGESSVVVNDTAIGSATVPLGWSAGAPFNVRLAASREYTDFDEFALTGVGASPALDVAVMRDYWSDPLPTVVGGSTGAEVLSDPSTSTYIQMSATQEAYLQFEPYTLPDGWIVTAAWLSFVARQAGSGDAELGAAAEFDVYSEGSGNAALGSANISGLTSSFATYTTAIEHPETLTAARLAEGLAQCDVWNYSTGSSVEIAHAQLHLTVRGPVS